MNNRQSGTPVEHLAEHLWNTCGCSGTEHLIAPYKRAQVRVFRMAEQVGTERRAEPC